MQNDSPDNNQSEALPLSRSAEFLLDECRMVLPGIQALFGFQLIVVFNPGFTETLDRAGQSVHLVAIALIAVAIALIMTPAAFHRQTDPRKATGTFIVLSTRLLLWSMLPLCLGICLDFSLIAFVILDSLWAVAMAVVLFAAFVLLWFVVPHSRALQSAITKP